MTQHAKISISQRVDLWLLGQPKYVIVQFGELWRFYVVVDRQPPEVADYLAARRLGMKLQISSSEVNG